MSEEKLSKKCLGCGKVKLIKGNFASSPFIEGNVELYCKNCKTKMLTSKDALIDYLSQHQIEFNEDTYKEAKNHIQERELKKLKLQNITELPDNWEQNLFLAISGKFFSLINLFGDFKATPLKKGKQNRQQSTPQKVTRKTKVKKSDITDDMISKWGSGYTPDLYELFENKYNRLSNTYQLPTESHKEFLIKACVCSVKADLAMAEDDVKSAKDWMTMFKETTSAGKLQPSQMSKADLSQGMDTFGQLTRMVEEAVDIIPILPQFKKKPKDMPDFNIWCWINYVRDLQGLPLCKYEDVYKFYEDRRKDYLESGFIEEEL